MLDPPLSTVLKYLRIYFEKGVRYGEINAARCALSLILPRSQRATIGEHFLVKWFCKSCHDRYDSFWNVQVVLDWILSLSHNSELTLKMLSFKLTILLLLVFSQRGQTILNLAVDRMSGGTDGYF